MSASSHETVGLGRWGKLFVVGMVLYSGARAAFVAETLGAYGVNPWIFLVLDVGSAVPLSVGQVRLLQALRRREPARLQGALALTAGAFLAPYLYLLIGGTRPLPTVAYVAIFVLVLGFGLATAWRIRAEARGLSPAQRSADGQTQRDRRSPL